MYLFIYIFIYFCIYLYINTHICTCIDTRALVFQRSKNYLKIKIKSTFCLSFLLLC